MKWFGRSRASNLSSAESADRPGVKGFVASYLRPGAPWAIFGLVMFTLVGWPLIMLVVGMFRSAPPGANGGWTLQGFVQAYGSRQTYVTLLNSLILTVSATTLGMFLALWLLTVSTKTTLRIRRAITPSVLFLLAIPPMFYGISVSMLGNPRSGLLDYLVHLGDRGTLGFVNSTSWAGMILTSSCKAMSWAYVLLLAPFRSLDGSHEEAASLSGATRLRVLWKVSFPMLRPALVAVGVLMFVTGLETFDVPLILGLPAGIRVFSTQIFSLADNTIPPQYGAASGLSLLLVVLVIVLVLFARRSLKGRSFTTVDAKARPAQPWRMRRLSGSIVSLGTAAFLLGAVVLPMAQMILGSFQGYFGVYGSYTIQNYVTAFQDPGFLSSIRVTVLIAVVGGGISMLIATVISYVHARLKTRSARALELLAWLPLGLPGIVLALGLLWGYTSVPILKDLYGTPWIMLLGLVVVGLPVGSRATDGSIAQISEDLEHAARLSGATRSKTVLRILTPLLTPSFLAGWFTVAIVLSGNLDVPILLSTASAQPASVFSYNVYQNGQLAQAAALLCIVLVAGAAAVLVGAGLGHMAGRALVTVRSPFLARAKRREASRLSAAS